MTNDERAARDLLAALERASDPLTLGWVLAKRASPDETTALVNWLKDVLEGIAQEHRLKAQRGWHNVLWPEHSHD